jgi:chemotaxis protein CheX
MKPKLDANFINPFISGTVSTLKIQCSVDAHAGTAFLKSKTSPKLKTDIAGLIGITSEAFRGNIAICFPEKTFLGIMSQMLGEEFTEINNEVEDGAGELMNIIFGTAKKVLN